MKRFRKFLNASMLLVFTSLNMVHAQSDSVKVDFSVGADLVNRYVWRGLMLGNAASIQPSVELTYGGFSFGSWASYTMGPAPTQEVDLYLTYSVKNFTVGLNDYYNPVDSLWTADSYFDFGKNTTLHTFEPFICFSEIGGTPFSATASVFVYGNDRDENNKNLFSSYLELGYSTTVSDYGISLFAGGTFNKGYYAEKPAIVNTGVTISREIKLSGSYSVPVKGSFIVNPNTQNVYLVFGFSF